MLDFLSQFSYMTNCWNRNFFKKYYILPIMPLLIGEECISDVTELELLFLLRPVLGNALASFHEICNDPLEKTATNMLVCL